MNQSLLFKYLAIKLALASQGPVKQNNIITLPSKNFPDTNFIVQTNDLKSGNIIDITGPNAENLVSYLNQKVSLTCIRKGLIGMPNITLPNYLGEITPDNKNYSKCYIYLEEV